MKKIILPLLILCFHFSFGQTTFQKIYKSEVHGNPGNLTVQQTTDGGYIMIGTTTNYGAGGYDAYMIKTDAYGDTEWTKTYGGQYEDWGTSGQQTSDGGYIICGYSWSFTPSIYIMLIKTDQFGDTLWTKLYSGGGEAQFTVKQTRDHGYIISAPGALIKTDSIGNIVWSKKYESYENQGPSWIGIEDIEQCNDDGFIVSGTVTGGNKTDNKYLFKTDENGKVLWSKYFGIESAAYKSWVKQTFDGGYIVQGGMAVAFLMKVDSNGVQKWSARYSEDFSISGGASCFQQTRDSNYVLIESLGSNINTKLRFSRLIKMDPNGNIIWTKAYGDSLHYFLQFNRIQQTNDDGYIIAGNLYDSSDEYIAFIKTDASGNSDCNNEMNIPSSFQTSTDSISHDETTLVSVINPAVTGAPVIIGSGGSVASLCSLVGTKSLLVYDGFSLYPNPATNQLTINTSSFHKAATVLIMNMLGQITSPPAPLLEERGEAVIDVSHLSAGMYFLQLKTESGSVVKKFVKE